MTDQPETVPVHALFKVLAALADLGDATAAAVAEHADLGYSTATAKLRVWEGTGQTERVQGDDKRAVWRLTDSGHATVGAGRTASPTDSSAGPESPPDDSPSTGDAVDDDLGATSDTEQSGDQHTTPTPDSAADGEPPTSAAEAHAHVDEPTAGDDDPAPTVDDPPQAGTLDDGEAKAVANPDAATTAPGRRAKGSLRAAVLDILEAHPDRAYKTGELCKLIDAAYVGTGAKKASAGAVVNAADKLVGAGKAIRTEGKHTTFQFAPAAQ